MTCTVKQTHITASKDRSVDSKGVRFIQTDQVTLSDTVQFPQIWPLSALQFEYVSGSVSFMSLDIKMFVAGELEVILSKRVGATEKLGRLKLLKKMMYFANIYEWKALLKFYAAMDICIRLNLCLNAPIKHGTTI